MGRAGPGAAERCGRWGQAETPHFTHGLRPRLRWPELRRFTPARFILPGSLEGADGWGLDVTPQCAPILLDRATASRISPCRRPPENHSATRGSGGGREKAKGGVCFYCPKCPFRPRCSVGAGLRWDSPFSGLVHSARLSPARVPSFSTLCVPLLRAVAPPGDHRRAPRTGMWRARQASVKLQSCFKAWARARSRSAAPCRLTV